MLAGRINENGEPRLIDLVTVNEAMAPALKGEISEADLERLEQAACPTCGSCAGMFTANSMNCLNEAIGLALPGNGTVVATHRKRLELFERAAARIVQMAEAYYFEEDESVLPRSIANQPAFENAMALDIAMGGYDHCSETGWCDETVPADRIRSFGERIKRHSARAVVPCHGQRCALFGGWNIQTFDYKMPAPRCIVADE